MHDTPNGPLALILGTGGTERVRVACLAYERPPAAFCNFTQERGRTTCLCRSQ